LVTKVIENNISAADKEETLWDIIRAQMDLIKTYQEILDKYEGKQQLRIELHG